MQVFRRSQNKKGFTIIEVLIVLAIAGLILAIVFFAVPQLQRNQRDNQRRGTATRLKAELETYAANHQGQYPFTGVVAAQTSCNAGGASLTCGDWFTNYISGKVNVTDPSTGNATSICYSNAVAAIAASGGTDGNCVAAASWARGNMWIGVGDKCNAGGDNLAAGSAVGSATSKQYAVVMALDRAGSFYCVDNG